MATFEEQLNNLLERTHSIKSPINAAAIGTDINEYNRPSEVWINDVEIFYNNYLKEWRKCGPAIKNELMLLSF